MTLQDIIRQAEKYAETMVEFEIYNRGEEYSTLATSTAYFDKNDKIIGMYTIFSTRNAETDEVKEWPHYDDVTKLRGTFWENATPQDAVEHVVIKGRIV